jgi:hypothetical protein
MKRLCLLLLLAPLLAAGEALDRIAVIAGDQVITENTIRRQIRLTAFLQNERPDYSLANKRRTAELLLRQTIVRKEIELSRYTPPGMDEVEKQIENNIGKRGPEFLQQLEKQGFTELDLKETFLALVSFNRFVTFRFNPGVTISEDEIREYYEKEYVPAKLKSSATDPVEPMDQLRASIVRILEVRKANVALDQWLEQARQQVNVRFVEEVFR